MTPRTNYIGHDDAYKKRKAEGQPGWGWDKDYQRSETILEKVLQAEHVPKSGRLLELGCGAGNITLWLAEKGFEVYGVDIAPTAIEWAKEKAREQNLAADFRVGNVLDLEEYPDDFFDFVLDGHCFHCIIGVDRQLFLASAYRVLKPGGFFHVDTMCGNVIDEEVKKHFHPESRCLIYNGIATRYIGLVDDVLLEIQQAGFQIVHWELESPNEGDVVDTGLLVNAIKRL
jgi:ubiquinone/menaquinone biosynthesis C-methylase UbiE